LVRVLASAALAELTELPSRPLKPQGPALMGWRSSGREFALALL
jgi:hypothetical protein